MNKFRAVVRKEFNTFWYSPIAYVVLVVFLVLMTWLFFSAGQFYLQNNADMRPFFGILPWIFLFIMPALTMRQWAEEHKTGTLELLMTKPVSELQVVLGKFCATLLILLVMLLLTLPLTLTVGFLSQNGLEWGVVFTSYLGALLLGATYLAIGGWISSVTQNQIVAFIIGLAAIFIMIMVGEMVVTMFLPGALTPLLSSLGLRYHFNSISRGVIDTRDILYYLSVTGFFLYLTVRAVEHRKWS